MDEIVTLTQNIATTSKAKIAGVLMTVFRTITPQFYRGMSDKAVETEIQSIALLTHHIDNHTLAKMCELAIINYPKARSIDAKIFFDINYVLTYFKIAFNFIHSDSIDLPIEAEFVWSRHRYDHHTETIHETWCVGGQEFHTAEIRPLSGSWLSNPWQRPPNTSAYHNWDKKRRIADGSMIVFTDA